ncbi:hypothetical protein FACS189421_11020 [Bacteroidia bacterium]|nr:hypothetical protein FACS189421_11020 [Bacteroidia bacterium]
MKKYDIVILHGTGGSPDGNWFPWLREQLTARGHRVFVPRFPTPDEQSVETWNRALKEQVPQIGSNTILIGHSCGATYILHILESLENPVHASILVSGFIDKLGNEWFDIRNETFVNHKFDWEKIKKNAGRVTLLAGDNDPYVPASAARKLADALSAQLTIIPGGGHLNSEFGYTEFPEILKIVETAQ